jgi:hypothetical protein
LDLALQELSENTAVRWPEWGGLSGEAGVEEQMSQVGQGVLVGALSPSVAQMRQQLRLQPAESFAAGPLVVRALGLSEPVPSLCLVEEELQNTVCCVTSLSMDIFLNITTA